MRYLESPDTMRAALWRAVAKTLHDPSVPQTDAERSRILAAANVVDAILEPHTHTRLDQMIQALAGLQTTNDITSRGSRKPE